MTWPALALPTALLTVVTIAAATTPPPADPRSGHVLVANQQSASAFVTLAADDTMGVVDLEARTLTRKVKVEKSPDGVWFGPLPR